MKELYVTLNINENASDNEIRQAYKTLAFKYHPDKNKDINAADEFKKVRHAYEILSDPQKKKIYDQYGDHDNNIDPNLSDISDNSFFFGDIFNNLFNTEKKKTNKNFNTYIDIDVTLNEAMNGIYLNKEFLIKQICNTCKGKCEIFKNKCVSCNGTGKLFFNTSFIQIQQCCKHCNGIGYKEINKCKKCNALGYLEKKKKIKINIPRGLQNNDEFLFKIKNENKKYGNLIFKINILKSDVIEIKNNNLFIYLNINFIDAILGADLIIPFFKEKIKINILPGTQTGTLLKINNKGYYYKDSDKRGDLYIKINIEIPKQLSIEQKNILVQNKEIFIKNYINNTIETLKNIF